MLTFYRHREMSEERMPNKSIWRSEDANNPSPPPSSNAPFPNATSTSSSSSGTTPIKSRSRAGTLPSRLSPGLQISTATSSAATNAPIHSTFVNNSSTSLGSLALLSPTHDNNPSPIGSPSLLKAGVSSENNKAGLTSASTSRLRSGSLNVLTEDQQQQQPPKFSPFGPSIWASNDNSSTDIEQPPPPPQVDPMQPFLNELSAKTDVSRLRSYTVNTMPYDNEPPHQQQQQVPPPPPQQHQQYAQPQQPYVQQQQQMHLHPNMITNNNNNSNNTNNQHLVNRPRSQTASAAFDPSHYNNQQSPLARSLSYKQSNQHLSPYDTNSVAANSTSSLDDSQVAPSRSLWLGNIPSSTTSYSLQAIFSAYGPIESARVLTHKNCGFIDFLSVDSAIHAKSVLNGKELFAGSGPCRVRFAKSVPASERTNNNINNEDLDYDNNSNSNIEYSVTDKESMSLNQDSVLQVEPVKPLSEIKDDIIQIVADLGGDENETNWTRHSIERSLEFNGFEQDIPLVPEPSPDRVYDAPTLREVRKKIDSGTCTQQEVEEIAVDLLDEIAELSSDYVGNTVVQKLFDTCSEPIKELMLDRIAPYLAQIGIHKNGTWAAQKIIDVAGSPRQYDLISKALRPYTVHLFLDQFGNYVIQCCLKYGSPWNDFIFETMLSKFWDIAQGRFGARAMRACLESHYATKEQQRILAAAITLHAVQLATNANGALLLTWFLDTCTLPNRHSILAPRLIPSLVQLCTHKLACLTVLKVINHKADPVARQSIFDALFNPEEETPSEILEQILSDHMYGPTFIYKVISTPFLEYTERQNAVNKIRTVLISIKALPSQGYKRLMDEVGLATRTPSQRNGNGGTSQGGGGVPNNNSQMKQQHHARNNNRGNNTNNHRASPPKQNVAVPPSQGYYGGPPQMFAPQQQYGGQQPIPPQYDMGLSPQFDQLSLNDPTGQYRQQQPPPPPHPSMMMGGGGVPQQHTPESDMVYMRMPEQQPQQIPSQQQQQQQGGNPIYMAGPMGYPQYSIYEQQQQHGVR